MRIITLMEDTAVSEQYACGHGLCFYIETKNHKILFDMGPDARFLDNAVKLGVDISKVDTAILSHGHDDHGGGLKAFLQANATACVHMQKKAFGEFYSKREDGEYHYIGLPMELKEHPRIVVHTGDYMLDAGMQIFGGVTGRDCYSPANDRLFMSINGRYIQDLFMHEQNLLIKEGNKMVLMAGCAHNGMVNILNKARTFAPGGIHAVIGGMHLVKAYPEREQRKMLAKKMADRLREQSCSFYTCHCTGTEAYGDFHEELGSQIHYLAAGSVLEIS